MPRVFSSQIEDAQQPASNQTGEGGDNENSSADEGPDDGAESGSRAGSDHRAWCRGSKRQQCGQPRPTTSIFIGERCFFCSPFCCSSKKKTRWRHSAAPERGANSRTYAVGPFRFQQWWNHGLVRYELQELNKQAGVYFIRRHTDPKQGELSGNWIFRRKWTSNKGSILNTIVQCTLVKRCSCPCQVKIVQIAAQVIMSIADLHTARNHVEDKVKFLTHQERSLVATALKLAPMNSASQLLARVQDSPTKKIDAAWKNSVQRMIRQER